jgi:hypothetical protein
MKTLDLTGQQYGRWMVLQRAGSDKRGEAAWWCECSCGGRQTILGSNLRSGRTQSCGCLRQERSVECGTRHGHASHRAGLTLTYISWQHMIQRCTNPKRDNWRYYGARGIGVCQAWRDSFETFLGDMGPRPSQRYSIDRINGDGHYEPGNCRWATQVVQVRNRRPSVA